MSNKDLSEAYLSEDTHTPVHKIWVIDDEIELAEIFSHYLSENYQTQAFSSAEVALKEFEKDPKSVDLILTDIRMPGMDGVTFLEKLRSQEGSPPVILMSGYADKSQLIKASTLNIAGFLEKPCSPRDVETIVQKTLPDFYFNKLKDELIFTLANKASVTSELLKLYFERYIHAENIIYQKKLPLHNEEKKIQDFLTQMQAENRLNKELEEIDQKLKSFRQKKIA